MPIPKTPPHPLWTRLAHGLDLALLLLMASSGLQIYNANPVFGGREGATMPDLLLLGGWLAGGRQWHFAFMGLFALNLGLCIALLLWKRRRRLAESADLQALRTSRNEAKRRVSAHRLLYTLMLIVLSFGLITGLAMYKPASLWWLSGLFGSWQTLRALHFATVPAMAALIVKPQRALLADRRSAAAPPDGGLTWETRAITAGRADAGGCCARAWRPAASCCWVAVLSMASGRRWRAPSRPLGYEWYAGL